MFASTLRRYGLTVFATAILGFGFWQALPAVLAGEKFAMIAVGYMIAAGIFAWAGEIGRAKR